jgi:cytochrome c553
VDRRESGRAALGGIGGVLLLAALLLAPGRVAGHAPAAASTRPATEAAAEVLALEPDLGAGAELFERCAVCHGADAGGRPDGLFPKLAGQHRSVLVKQLLDIRAGRRSNPVMEPYVPLDERDVADVAAYVASLPTPSAQGRGPGEDLARGAELYERDCADCHGLRGEGDAAHFIPRLGGQHFGYLLRQVRTIAADRRANAHPDMVEAVSAYTDAELRAVVDHAARLPGTPGTSRDADAARARTAGDADDVRAGTAGDADDVRAGTPGDADAARAGTAGAADGAQDAPAPAEGPEPPSTR